MSSNELLSEIKKAEEDANKAVTEALEKKKQIISEANNKARQIIDDGKINSIKSIQNAIKYGEEELENQRKNIISNGLIKIDLDSSKSKSNISKAIDYLLEEFEKEIRL